MEKEGKRWYLVEFKKKAENLIVDLIFFRSCKEGSCDSVIMYELSLSNLVTPSVQWFLLRMTVCSPLSVLIIKMFSLDFSSFKAVFSAWARFDLKFVKLKLTMVRIKWGKFSFWVSVKRLFLKAFSMGAINCGKQGCFEIAKLQFCFKTEHCISEKVVLQRLRTIFSFTAAKTVG